MHNFMYRRRGTGPQILIRGTYALKWWVISSTLRSIYPCVVTIGQEAGWVTESVPKKWRREKSLSHPGIDPQSQDHSQSFHLLRYLHTLRLSFTLFIPKCPLRRNGHQQPEHCIRGFETHFIQGLCPCMSALCLYVGKYHLRRCTVFKSYQLHQTVTVSELSIYWQGSRAWSVPCYGKDNPKCLIAHNTPVCNLIFCWADPINYLVYIYYTHYFHYRFLWQGKKLSRWTDLPSTGMWMFWTGVGQINRRICNRPGGQQSAKRYFSASCCSYYTDVI